MGHTCPLERPPIKQAKSAQDLRLTRTTALSSTTAGGAVFAVSTLLEPEGDHDIYVSAGHGYSAYLERRAIARSLCTTPGIWVASSRRQAKPKPPQVRSRFAAALVAGADIYVSAVVAFELWYRVAKSKRRELNTERVETFFAGPVQLWPMEDDDARAAGEVRAQLEAAGQPIGAYDALIAGQAVQRGATLVTANVGEFARVEGLKWESWS